MRRKALEQTATAIRSRKLARALCRIGPVTARTIRATWTATDRQFGTGRYRWYRAGLRVELARLRVASPPWPSCVTA